MKTFFLALILGIFIGSIVTNYFADPQAYQHLKEAKARLFEEDAAPEAETSLADTSATSEPAQFQVGSGDLAAKRAAEEEESAKPLPLPKPSTKAKAEPEAKADPKAKAEPEAETPTAPEGDAVETAPETESPSAPETSTQESDSSQESAPKSRSEAIIEEGTKKAEEIAKSVSEKAKEVAEDAKPLLEDGIDLTIAAAIRAQYKLERGIDSDAIALSVKDKIVTLSGTVASEAAKQRAIEIAVFTKGVHGVEETLSIAE
ncbi:BON domain-containing protein [Pelagicoccus sp. SDUM812005]|uniref:BON domain-containing protein n=1 Tax=Pelagicoccus sp. SDUM812005 TaxID=3041257 RepID=UPI00280DD275|nr:BON domain-containing protein [Pelagicoccus sp. SDUM812005]MDQ8183356.1 BON domain-containing protein [Pelagicoccus sp. SDUM812005]